MNDIFPGSSNARQVYDILLGLGMTEQIAVYANLLLLLCATFGIMYAAYIASKKVLVGAVHKFAARSSTKFDDFLISNKVTYHLAKVVPLIILVRAIPFIFADFTSWIALLGRLTDVYMVLLSIWVTRAFLRTCRDYLKTTETFRDKPIDSFVQVLNIFLFFIGGLLVFSLLSGKEIWAFITAMGAASAILLLMFKDTIMGFVASIQVSSNDMVRIGDWITMEKYGADGDVIEINLTTVKVQNFDKTITTIPTYNLISDSFKNWRGMQKTGGRRIKRSVLIKISSIRYLSEDDIKRLSKIQLIADYLEQRQQEIHTHNRKNNIDKSVLINGRSLTNIGVFRKYITAYLEQHQHVHKGLALMVRQLAPTTTGMPIELYVFTNDVRWAVYEQIQADIFDHLLAAVKYFDLEVFEMPAADDVRALRTPEALLQQPQNFASLN